MAPSQMPVAADFPVWKGNFRYSYYLTPVCKGNCRCSYHINCPKKSLNVRCPSELRAQMQSTLYNRYVVPKMGANIENWLDKGSVKASFGGGSIGGPYPKRYGKYEWPTLIVQAGFSEPQSFIQLHKRIQHWFQISDHQIKVVLLVEFDQRDGSFTIESWKEERRLVNTLAGGLLDFVYHPRIQQAVTITKQKTLGNVRYNVMGGDLVLRFNSLFLQEPRGQESDIVINTNDLEKWAAHCWRYI